MKDKDDFLGADHWTWFVKRDWLASGEEHLRTRGEIKFRDLTVCLRDLVMQRRAGALNFRGDLNLRHLDLRHLTVCLGYLVVQIGAGLDRGAWR